MRFDELGRRLNVISERYVYHYTGLAGLRGIAAKGRIWASDYRFLNDQTELNFGLEILEMLVAHRDSTPSLSLELGRQILIEIALIKRSSIELYVFCVSFCQKGNLLSQWRAYAPQDGVSIGFLREHVTRKAGAHGFTVGSVHYYSEGRDLGHWLANRAEQLTLEQDRSSSEAQGRLNLTRWICETAAFIKHPMFQEEAEWRCVRVVDSSEIGGPEIESRVSGPKVIPYIELDLADSDDGYFGVSVLVIGPTADAAATQHAVSHLTRGMGVRDGLVVQTPFNPIKLPGT